MFDFTARIRPLVAQLVVCAMICAPGLEETTSRADPGIIILTMLLPVVLTVAAVPPMTTTGLGVSTTGMVQNDDGDYTQRTPEEHHRALDAFVHDNALELRDAVALGGGPALDDLMDLVDVAPEHRRAFASQARARRGAFDRVLEMAPGAERGEALLSAVQGFEGVPAAVALANP